MSTFRTQHYTLLAVLTVVFVCLYLFTTPTNAAPNQQINYQGKLASTTGAAVGDTSYDMTFKLYTVSTGGSAIWTETLTGADAVPTVNGLFSVMLGSTTPLTNVDFNQTLYLGIEIGSDGEMTPRKILGTVPAAFDTVRLGGATSTSYLRSDEDDTATGLLTFTGGVISSASSTYNLLNFGTATGTTLTIGSDTITDFTGTGLSVTSGTLNVSNLATSSLTIGGTYEYGALLQASTTATGGYVWSATSTLGIISEDLSDNFLDDLSQTSLADPNADRLLSGMTLIHSSSSFQRLPTSRFQVIRSRLLTISFEMMVTIAPQGS